MKKEYIRPDVFILELAIKRVLCSSPEGEMEEWTEDIVTW